MVRTLASELSVSNRCRSQLKSVRPDANIRLAEDSYVDLPEIVVTPTDDEPDDELSEAYRRYFMQEPDPFAEHCAYLTDDEIKQHLHWDELDAPEEWKQSFFQLCCEHREIFVSEGNMGQLQTVQDSIDTGSTEHIKNRPYRMYPEKREFVREAVKKMLDTGVIEPSYSPWSSPIVLVEKKDGDYRFCTDRTGSMRRPKGRLSSSADQ